MTKFKLTVIAIFSLMVFGNAWAVPLGTNITISDGNSSGSGWYSDREDNEVEPGMVTSQIWDLEGFFMKDKTLSVVGGYDFKNGVADSNSRSGDDRRWTGGDLFISTGQKPTYGDIHSNLGNGVRTVTNSYGYDYVFDIDYRDMSYDLYKIDENTSVQTPYFYVNEGSSPWLYSSGGELLDSGDPGEVYFERDVDVDGLFSGARHHVMALDMSYLFGLLGVEGFDGDIYYHYTMECGNDNLMGMGHQESAPVPEPATMLLLGTGLIGMAGAGRKKFKK